MAFVVEDQSLVARNVEVRPGLLVTETLTMRDDGNMRHDLVFSDNDRGGWICEN